MAEMSYLWSSHYPDPRVLKTEAVCMMEAFREVLLEEIPNSEIEGIYCKGSVLKDWDSSLDYVPELSDVDIHLLFHDDVAFEKYLGSVAQAMHIQSRVEERYFSKVPEPLHVLLPQLTLLNDLLHDGDYVHPPRKTVSVLYGKDVPDPDYGNPDRIRRTDCRRLLGEEELLKKRLPSHTVDRLAKYIWQTLRLMSWRVSPTGPRVLHILGLPTEEAWSVNRTVSVSLLRETGEYNLAQDYADYYLNAWEYYLSGYADSDAGRASIVAGAKVLGRGWRSRRRGSRSRPDSRKEAG
jgi:hypothetical protein